MVIIELFRASHGLATSIYIYKIEVFKAPTIFYISIILKKKKKLNNPVIRLFIFTMSSFSNTNSARSNSVFLLQTQTLLPSPSFNSLIETQLPLLLFIVSPKPSLSQSVTCLCSPMKNTNTDTNLLSRSVFFVQLITFYFFMKVFVCDQLESNVGLEFVLVHWYCCLFVCLNFSKNVQNMLNI